MDPRDRRGRDRRRSRRLVRRHRDLPASARSADSPHGADPGELGAHGGARRNDGRGSQVTSWIDRHHARIATFIENGVRSLGPEGAVRLIEEHAGDDLQYIRVNGTVVGGLAGGALYALPLLLGWL